MAHRNAVMTLTCKFTKLMGALAGRHNWSGADWANEVLSFLMLANWGLPLVIISDRDVRFLRGLWKHIWTLVETVLHYTAAYHPQADGLSERTSQTFEIALRHWVATHPGKRNLEIDGFI